MFQGYSVCCKEHWYDEKLDTVGCDIESFWVSNNLEECNAIAKYRNVVNMTNINVVLPCTWNEEDGRIKDLIIENN